MSAAIKIEDFAEDFCLLGLEADQALIGLGPFETAQEPNPDKPSFFIQDFYLSQPASWYIPRSTKLIPTKLLKQLCTQSVKANFTPPDRNLYEKAFENLLKKINAGKLEKAVPVIFEKGALVQGDLESLLPALAHLPGFLNPFAFRLGNKSVVGLSPEILFRKEQESQLIVSEAVAGTTLSANSDRLLDDPHLKKEHSLVIADIQKQLSNLGRSRVSTISLQPYPGLMHLRAEITVEVDSKVTPYELIKKLHPTGALGILPRSELQGASIRDLDPMECREIFGAPFGVVLPNGYWKFVVVIRCLMLEGENLLLGSGGGIIATSKLSEEWAELQDKRESVKRMFSLL